MEELEDSRYLLRAYDASDTDRYWDIYNQMNFDLIDKIGLSPEYLSIYFLERELLKYESEYYSTDNEALITFIELKKRQIRNARSFNKGDKSLADINADMHRELTRWLKFDSKTLTVFEYYRNIKLARAESEAREFKNMKIA